MPNVDETKPQDTPVTKTCKKPKLTFQTTDRVRRLMKIHVIQEGTTLDKLLHSLTEAYLRDKGLLSSESSAEGV